MKKYSPGQIVLLSLVFLAVFVTLAVTLLNHATLANKAARITAAREAARFLAEAGIDKAVYELNQISSYTGEANTVLDNGVFSVIVTGLDSSTKRITATGYVPNSTSPIASQTIRINISTNPEGITFRYGSQAGQGGIYFSNGSHLDGNLYANGNIVGSNGAYITGTTYVAGSSGSISNMSCLGGTANGSACTSASGPYDAHAHSITGSKGTGVFYCQTGSGNSPASCNTSQSDPGQEAMPISDADITRWKNDAAAGTVINGNYTLSSGQATLGPTKIIGNLTISGTASTTIANTIWVTGNISFSGTGGGSKVKLNNTYGSQSGIIIADGLISIGNNVAFQDSGTSGSYIMLLTTSTCDESVSQSPCSGNNAIEINNNAAIVIANAQQGTINFANNATVKEVVGKTIRLKNNVGIQYGSGLPSTLFQSGSGGAWSLVLGSYVILR